MVKGVYVFMQFTLPPTNINLWEQVQLRTQYDKLVDVDGFEQINMGDDDLLGGEITVKGVTTKEEALAELEDMGFPIDEYETAPWQCLTDDKDGGSAIRFELPG